jgi:hypothetical protein
MSIYPAPDVVQVFNDPDYPTYEDPLTRSAGNSSYLQLTGTQWGSGNVPQIIRSNTWVDMDQQTRNSTTRYEYTFSSTDLTILDSDNSYYSGELTLFINDEDNGAALMKVFFVKRSAAGVIAISKQPVYSTPGAFGGNYPFPVTSTSIWPLTTGTVDPMIPTSSGFTIVMDQLCKVSWICTVADFS